MRAAVLGTRPLSREGAVPLSLSPGLLHLWAPRAEVYNQLGVYKPLWLKTKGRGAWVAQCLSICLWPRA